jgi:hypothetical protein
LVVSSNDIFVEGIVWKVQLFFKVKTYDFLLDDDGAVHCSLLEGVVFGEPNQGVAFCGGLGPGATSGQSFWQDIFIFLSFFLFFLVVCILNVSTSSGRYVGAETGCNWYLLDINILPLSEKTILG